MTFKQFLNSEGGAVTTDWVVITALVAGLCLATTAVVSVGMEDLSGDMSAAMTDTDPASIHDEFGAAAGAWGDLALFSPHQSAEGAESYAVSVLSSNGGDHQAAYEQLYQQALDMTFSQGESIDDLGAFEALAASDGVTLDRGDNLTYAELHAQYEADPWGGSNPGTAPTN